MRACRRTVAMRLVPTSLHRLVLTPRSFFFLSRLIDTSLRDNAFTASGSLIYRIPDSLLPFDTHKTAVTSQGANNEHNQIDRSVCHYSTGERSVRCEPLS